MMDLYFPEQRLDAAAGGTRSTGSGRFKADRALRHVGAGRGGAAQGGRTSDGDRRLHATAVPRRPPLRPGAARSADAVLYEGYVLYPYRASARPRTRCAGSSGCSRRRPYSEAAGSEPWAMQTECVVEPGDHAGRPTSSCAASRCSPAPSRPVVDGDFRRCRASRSTVAAAHDLGRGGRAASSTRRRRARPGATATGGRDHRRSSSTSPAGREVEPLRDPDGAVLVARSCATGAGPGRRRGDVASGSTGPYAAGPAPGPGREPDAVERARRARGTRSCAAFARRRPHAAGRRPAVDSVDSSTRPSSPASRRRSPARTSGPSRARRARRARTTAPSCCRRRSSSTTTPRWPPRAPATCSTPPRSTRSSRCGS